MDSMLNFRMCGHLVFGVGAIRELPDRVHALGGGRPLLVTDRGLVKAGVCDQVRAILDEAGIRYDVFDAVEADPSIEVALACADRARRADVGLLIGLGGGSSLDIAKVTAVLLRHDGDIADLLGVNQVKQAGVPTIMIPTTAGTGSEVTPIAVLSDNAAHLKKGIVSDFLYANVALVDPALSVSLPPGPTAYTGVDALTHAIEAYTNKFAQPFVDTLALEAIRLIGANLRKAVRNGHDIETRYAMALGSLYGGLCLGPVNTAAVHALAYPLGGTFNVPHGIANSLLLPYVMAFNTPACTAKLGRIAEALGEDVRDRSPEDAAADAVAAVARLCRDVGIVSNMRELGIEENAIEAMAEGAMKVTRLLNNNPREVTLTDAEAIYRSVFTGELTAIKG